MTSRLKKGSFRLMPDRAFVDTRMTGTHYRVLAAITYFDRAGANGRGCTASQSSIANMAQCHQPDVSSAIKDMLEWGHIAIVAGGGKGRRAEYGVVYEGQDVAETYSAEAIGSGDEPIAPKLYVEAETYSAEAIYKDISLNAKGYSAEAAYRSDRLKGYSAEAAPNKNSARNSPSAIKGNENDEVGKKTLSMFEDGAFIAMLDREVRRGRLFSKTIADALYERLEGIHDGYETGDPIAGRAYRLLTEIELCREDAAA